MLSLWFATLSSGCLFTHIELVWLYDFTAKSDGRWFSKSALLHQAAARCSDIDLGLIWHKIVITAAIDTIKGSKSTYTHFLCFSQQHRELVSQHSPDLIANRGHMTWARAMGTKAAEFACKYIQLQLPHCNTIIDPFCGQGSLLSIANYAGFNTIGVELSRKRVVLARKIDVKRWMTNEQLQQMIKEFQRAEKNGKLNIEKEKFIQSQQRDRKDKIQST